MVRVVLKRVVAMFGARRTDAQLDAEIRDHLDHLAEDHVRRGLSPRDARAAARRDFGGVDQVKEVYREQLAVLWLDHLLRDLRIGMRSLARTPMVTAVIVLTLAIGVGATTAIFSVVDAVVLKPFAYAGADRLVAIHELVRRIPVAPQLPVNAMHFEEWRRRGRSFEQMAVMRDANVNLTGAGEPERLTIGRSSANLFAMLGVRPQLGRLFLDDEDRDGRDGVVILTDGLWRSRFAADPGVIGREIVLDGRPLVVVGVLPAGFTFPRFSDLYAMTVITSVPDLWKPFGLRDAERSPSGDFNYACIGKLRPGVTVAQATAELDALQAGIDRALTEPLGLATAIVPLAQQVTSRSRAGLWLLLAASGVVLFIGCINVAGLLLGRTAQRHREIAIRKAVGASASRLICQLLVECAVLCGTASALGILLAYVMTRTLARWAPADLPQVNTITIDERVLVFALAAFVVTTILVGILPAWRATRLDPGGETARFGQVNATRATTTARSLLVAAEIGVSTICLVAAALLLHGFARLMHVDKGFDERVLLVDMSLSPRRYPDLPATTSFTQTTLDLMAAVPGVISAGVVSQPPLAGVGDNNSAYVDGVSWTPAQVPIVDFRPSSASYFKTMGIPLRRGRVFDERDAQHRVAVVSASVAARLWPGQDPLGKTFHLGDPARPAIDVVGVVGDVRGVSLSDPPSLTVYLPYWQRAFNRNRVTLAVKASGDATAAAAAVRRAVHRIDPELPVPAFRTMTGIIDASTASRRFQRNLLAVFALVALVLVSLGTYGVISYSVTQRTREIGIRVALGAMPGAVVGDVLADAARMAIAGLAVGVPSAIAVAYSIRSLLFGVGPADAASIVAACAVLGATAFAAAFTPAVRASRIDPVVALRQE